MNRIKKISPLTETTFYILISLLEPLHGYGIMQKVINLSKGRIHLGPGTLYGALSNLVGADLIIPKGSLETNPRRKIYIITELGKELIKYEIRRLKEMVQNGENLLHEKGAADESGYS
ncbi:MAG: PadR family transcriptional regulator [Actinobacteria bacterium]|nr:PadR family transcriptional regulator [Actinomycetota bacterium]